MTGTKMRELDDEDLAVLELFQQEERVNPYLLREETGLGKGDVNTILNRLAQRGLIRKKTRGLYDVTQQGLDFDID